MKLSDENIVRVEFNDGPYHNFPAAEKIADGTGLRPFTEAGPELDGGLGIVAGTCHEDQPDLVRLGLVASTERKLHAEASADAIDQSRIISNAKADEKAPQGNQFGARELFSAMPGNGMANLMSNDKGQLRLIPHLLHDS